MENFWINFWIIISITLYTFSWFIAYTFFMLLSKSMDDDLTIKNLIISFFWPITIWFLK